MNSRASDEIRIVDPDVVYKDLTLPEPPDDRPYVVINMISTVDGKATVAGRSSTIGSPLDRILMRRIRTAVDAILAGAGTLRAEDIDPRVPPDLQAVRVARGMSPNPLAAILTASGEVPLDRKFFRLTDFQSVVFISSSAPRARITQLEARARVILLDPDQAALPHVMRLMRTDLGVRHLLIEGGPQLNAEAISQGFADELFLTVAPKVVAGPGKTIVGGATLPRDQIRRLELLSISTQESELFLRYRFL